jgi:biopolymer transport protein ExbB
VLASLIFLNGVVMWTLIIERLWYFKRQLPGETQAAIASWNARSDHLSWCARQIRDAMISRLRNAMSTNLLLMRVLVPLAPLLGLIGTVSGMLEVFDSMALRGSADARTMATGVSHAMFCTMSGLAVSILGLLPNYYFTDQVRMRTELFADQLRF